MSIGFSRFETEQPSYKSVAFSHPTQPPKTVKRLGIVRSTQLLPSHFIAEAAAVKYLGLCVPGTFRSYISYF